MKTNLERYAERMSKTIKEIGVQSYHWSEIACVIDELLKYVDDEKLRSKEGGASGRL